MPCSTENTAQGTRSPAAPKETSVGGGLLDIEAHCLINADVTLELLQEIVDAFNAKDVNRIVGYFAEGDAEIADTIREIDCPTLVMTGADDHGNSPEMTRRMADAIPGARSVILPGLRHMALAEAPEQFNAPLVSFLRDALAV